MFSPVYYFPAHRKLYSSVGLLITSLNKSSQYSVLQEGFEVQEFKIVAIQVLWEMLEFLTHSQHFCNISCVKNLGPILTTLINSVCTD